jgi:hypothetical protein
MSWWSYRARSAGGRDLYAVDVDPMAGLLCVGLAMCLAVLGELSAVLLLSGFLCLVVSKMSVFRRGIWTSWGPRLMSARAASVYRTAYRLMGCGAVLRVVLRL